MTLVVFQGPDGSKVYINPNLVSVVRASLDHPGCVEIVVDTGVVQVVQGVVDDIAAGLEMTFGG